MREPAENNSLKAITVTLETITRLTDMSANHWREQIRAGHLRAFHVGKRVLVRLSELERYLAEHEVAAIASRKQRKEDGADER